MKTNQELIELAKAFYATQPEFDRRCGAMTTEERADHGTAKIAMDMANEFNQAHNCTYEDVSEAVAYWIKVSK